MLKTSEDYAWSDVAVVDAQLLGTVVTSIVVHRIDAWSPLAPHRPDLYGDRDARSSDRGDRGDRVTFADRERSDRGLPAVELKTAPLPHIVSALPRAHNWTTDSDQPCAYRERSGTISTFSSWKDTFERQTSDGAVPRFARASSRILAELRRCSPGSADSRKGNALQSATKPRERGGGAE
eukprot:Skav228933  [mRNA]  locus=scaffold2181:289056:291029:+ [translate_table: standard]